MREAGMVDYLVCAIGMPEDAIKCIRRGGSLNVKTAKIYRLDWGIGCLVCLYQISRRFLNVIYIKWLQQFIIVFPSLHKSVYSLFVHHSTHSSLSFQIDTQQPSTAKAQGLRLGPN